MPATLLTLTTPGADWMRQAACAGRWDLMDAVDEETVEAAKHTCAACPVRRECVPPREDVDGIAGGMTADERAKVRRKIRRQRPIGAEKRCPECDEVKPIGEFYPHTGHSSGVGTACKPCHNRLRVERRRKPREAAS